MFQNSVWARTDFVASMGARVGEADLRNAARVWEVLQLGQERAVAVEKLVEGERGSEMGTEKMSAHIEQVRR